MNLYLYLQLHFFVGLHFIRVVTAQLTADIFLPTNGPIDQQKQPIASLTTAEFNALLSHRLNISQFETLPKSLYPSNPTAQLLFGDPHSDLPSHPSTSPKQNFLLVLYGANGHKVLPRETIEESHWLSLPNPPDVLSFDALFSVFIGRIVDTIKLPITSIYRVQDFIKAYHDGIGVELVDNVQEWASDWSDSLQDWILWAKSLHLQSPQPLSDQSYFDLLKDYGPLDHAAYRLIEDIKNLEEFQSMMKEEGKSLTKISFIRLSSLQQIQKRHGESSFQYRIGLSLMKSRISQLLSDPFMENFEKIIVTVSAQPIEARLGKRSNLSILSPFKTSEESFIRRELLERRRVIFGTTGGAIPIIPSGRKCFSTKNQCENDSESCNNHGSCIEGQKTSGGKCFVCVCEKSNDVKTGKVTFWSGDRCQKQDLSSGFVLLAGSAIGLLILFGLAIRLLMSIGDQGLPQQLASVSGSSKKND